MKSTLITQKNVCAFLGLIMALMIVFSAKATEMNVNEVSAVSAFAGQQATEEEVPMEIAPVEIESLKDFPTITLIDKHGKVVAELYGEKSEIEKRFSASFTQDLFVTAYGNHEFYLVK
jgi:hypothetical protein